jgi:phosphoketolase
LEPRVEAPRNHANLHVRAYKEEGKPTTPFDMDVMNDLNAFASWAT